MITLERFKDLVAAYGADPARWPERERVAALGLLERSGKARRLMDEAQAIDRLLDLSPTVAVTPELQSRILAQLHPRASSASVAGFLAALLPGRPAWLPAAALMASLALGLAVGTFAPAIIELDGGDGTSDAALVAMVGADFDDGAWDEMGDGT
jgi:hypothetical protein